jgi:hypothetical protein
MSNLATITNNILADSGIDDINVVVTTGSYANPAWITSLAWTKITGAPSGIVTGSGTPNTVPKFTGASTIGNSNITDSGSLIQLLSNTELQGKLYYTYDWLQEKNFGYSSGWKTLAIGSLTSANNFSLAFGVDVSGNPSGSFTGNGNEYFWRNTGSFKTPNAANNGYNQLFEWNSSGGMTFNQAAEFIGTVTVGSPLSIKSTTPYIQWINASSTRLAYIQHNATNLVYNADTGTHIFNQSVTVTDNLYVKNSAYPNIYYTSLRSIAGAIGVLQLGNNSDNYILVGNNAAGGYLSIRVNVSAESITSGTEALRIGSDRTATFYNNLTLSSASSTADLGGVLIVRGNGSAYTTHYLTTGAVNVAAYYQYDAAGTVKNLIHAGAASYITGGNFIVGNNTDSGNPYKIQALGSILVKGNVNDNYSFYNGVYASSTATINSQFTANWQSSNNWGIGVKGAADSTVYIGNTSAGVIDPSGTFRLSVLGGLSASGTAIFSSNVAINGVGIDADIAVNSKAPSGAGKYIYVGRDSSSTWNFSVSSSGDTQIGYQQVGATYKLLTLSSNGNDLDNGTVLRLIGNSALDLVDISVRDTTTRIYHQENTADALNGYGKIQFRTNATANGSFPTRGGFQFTVNTTDALFINSLGQATFSNLAGTGTRMVVADANGLLSTQAIGSGAITGSGTTNYLPKFTGSSTIGDSSISDVASSPLSIVKNASSITSNLIFISPTTGTNASILQLDNAGAGSFYIGRQNSAGNSVLLSGLGAYASVIGHTGSQTLHLVTNALSRVQIDGSGAATFSSSVTVGTNVALTPSGFGYDPSSYRTLIVGPTGNSIFRTLTFGVDVSGNPSGAFSGSGSEYVWRNTASFITPNAINNGFTTLLGWNSSGQITFNQGSLFASSLQVNGSLQIGDYTQGTNNLTFAASANGIAKINFYDSNNTEGLYIRTDGESQGGTMTFGARWDDDEPKIVFKMYQVSAGGPYNARVGIGTGALSPLSMLHVCELDGGNYTGTFRVGGSTTQFGIVADYTQAGPTTGTMYVSPSYSSADVLFKLGAGLGNTNQLVLRGNGSVGIGTIPSTNFHILAPNAILRVQGTSATDDVKLQLWSNNYYFDITNEGAGGHIKYIPDDDQDQIFYTDTANLTVERFRIGSRSTAGLTETTFSNSYVNIKQPSYSSSQTPLYVGNTGFAYNRQAYDTFILQQDDVTSFRMVEKNGATTTSDQVLTFSIGDGTGVIATSAQPLAFYVNGSPSGLAYQGLSGTQVLRLQTNGSANFYGALDVNGTLSTSGNFVATSSGIAEIRLRGGGYGTSYNTSLRSIVGAPGVLQMGNNGGNYILAGNTAVGGLLEFRVNCSSESVTSGSLALRLNANATATFASTVTATAFFESSDRRLKSNILDLDVNVSGIIAKTYLKNGVEEIGYLAQDVESILPSAISKRDDGYLDLSYRQVHTAKIAYLEKRITELEQQLKNK